MPDLPITPGEVKPIGRPVTDTRIVPAGLTVNAGEVLYIDANDEWQKAAAGLTVVEAQATHIALVTGSEGQPVSAALLQRGLIIEVGASAAPKVGILYVLSINAGRHGEMTDLNPGMFSTYLGTGFTTSQLIYNVNASGIQVS